MESHADVDISGVEEYVEFPTPPNPDIDDLNNDEMQLAHGHPDILPDVAVEAVDPEGCYPEETILLHDGLIDHLRSLLHAANSAADLVGYYPEETNFIPYPSYTREKYSNSLAL